MVVYCWRGAVFQEDVTSFPFILRTSSSSLDPTEKVTSCNENWLVLAVLTPHGGGVCCCREIPQLHSCPAQFGSFFLLLLLFPVLIVMYFVGVLGCWLQVALPFFSSRPPPGIATLVLLEPSHCCPMSAYVFHPILFVDWWRSLFLSRFCVQTCLQRCCSSRVTGRTAPCFVTFPMAVVSPLFVLWL